MVNQGRKTTMISTTIIANTNKMIAEIQKLQPNWKKEQGKKKNQYQSYGEDKNAICYKYTSHTDLHVIIKQTINTAPVKL